VGSPQPLTRAASPVNQGSASPLRGHLADARIARDDALARVEDALFEPVAVGRKRLPARLAISEDGEARATDERRSYRASASISARRNPSG
jgi:hypothetical protein